MKTLRIIAAFLVIVMAAGMLAACGGDTSADTEKTPETTSFSFESIGEKDSETEPPETETEREAERDEAPDADKEEDKKEEDEKDEKDADDNKNGIERSTYGETALAIAKELIGTKFKYGGEGPDTFDNSGFIYYIFKKAGTTVPRLARDMDGCGKRVSRDEIQPGDILVFANEIGGGAEFVGIYCGDNKFIACCNEDSPTDYQPIGNYWEQRFICGRRVG